MLCAFKPLDLDLKCSLEQSTTYKYITSQLRVLALWTTCSTCLDWVAYMIFGSYWNFQSWIWQQRGGNQSVSSWVWPEEHPSGLGPVNTSVHGPLTFHHLKNAQAKNRRLDFSVFESSQHSWLTFLHYVRFVSWASEWKKKKKLNGFYFTS